MSFLKNLFGNGAKEKIKQEKIADKLIIEKDKFTKEMSKIRAQSDKLSRQSQLTLQESKALARMVDSVTKNIAIATGGLTDGH